MDVERRPTPCARSADATHGPVVVRLDAAYDLPLVLVGSAEAEQRGAGLELVHVVPAGWAPIITGRAGFPPPRPRRHRHRRRVDEIDALRSRALTLAQLCAVPVTWTAVVGHPSATLETLCRDHHAALLVIGAERDALAARHLRSTLARARRLSRRAGTPIHLVCRG